MSRPQRLYLDNAATSFPKPPQVLEAMTHYATELGASPGRGAYAEARESTALLQQCRERLNQLIGGADPNHIIFTLNTSDALNLAIKGIVHHHLNRGRSHLHLVTTDLDHNSVLRPFNALCEAHPSITQTRVPADPETGLVDPADLRQALTPDTVLVATVHGSNVTGTLQPIRDFGKICREHAVPFLVDAAQSLGHLPLDVHADCIDLLAAPGHKGLLGPLGTGFLYIRPGLEKSMATTREGGTGSVSEDDTQPTFLPDRFEPGSHNAIGLIGLSEGVAYLLDQGVDQLWQHEQDLIKTMIEGLSNIHGLRYLGPQGLAHRCGVFSVVLDAYNTPQGPNDLAQILETQYGILTRSGIHCAPHAHRTMNTHETGGATRLSLGPYVTPQDVKYACDALAQVAEHAAVANA
ncbi:MAG: aminotransferase class V-fold PLP-dependent enzyme [Planctomycetota bacterium]